MLNISRLGYHPKRPQIGKLVLILIVFLTIISIATAQIQKGDPCLNVGTTILDHNLRFYCHNDLTYYQREITSDKLNPSITLGGIRYEIDYDGIHNITIIAYNHTHITFRLETSENTPVQFRYNDTNITFNFKLTNSITTSVPLQLTTYHFGNHSSTVILTSNDNETLECATVANTQAGDERGGYSLMYISHDTILYKTLFKFNMIPVIDWDITDARLQVYRTADYFEDGEWTEACLHYANSSDNGYTVNNYPWEEGPSTTWTTAANSNVSYNTFPTIAQYNNTAGGCFNFTNASGTGYFNISMTNVIDEWERSGRGDNLTVLFIWGLENSGYDILEFASDDHATALWRPVVYLTGEATTTTTTTVTTTTTTEAGATTTTTTTTLPGVYNNSILQVQAGTVSHAYGVQLCNREGNCTRHQFKENFNLSPLEDYSLFLVFTGLDENGSASNFQNIGNYFINVEIMFVLIMVIFLIFLLLVLFAWF